MTASLSSGGAAPSTEGGEHRRVLNPEPAGRRWIAAFSFWAVQHRRLWKGSLASRVLMPLMFLAAMGLVLGDLVDERSGGINGVPYLQFVVPAILVAQAMWLAISESTYPVLGAIQWAKQYHAMIATPLRVIDVLVGHLGYLVASLAVSTLIFVAVAAPFGAWGSAWVIAAVPFAVLTGLCFSAVCFALAAAVRGSNDVVFSLMFRVVMTPLFLFSGTFFPVEQLPVALRGIAYATPLWHGVEASRMLASGAVDPAALAMHGGYLIVVSAAACWWAYRALHSRLVV